MNDASRMIETLNPWKILIADDDADVHTTTRLALRGVSFRGRTLEFVDAYSGQETLLALQQHPDTAIVFLDVIMESDDAGLVAVRRIRENGFTLPRIIVRTGFPGQAPERTVIVDYDIHDYKEKTGLSVQKLFTSVISALRAYDDLVSLENHRRGLLSVLESSSSFDFNAVQRYVARMLAEFVTLARLGAGPLVAVYQPTARTSSPPTLLASLGDWPGAGEVLSLADLPATVSTLLLDSLAQAQAMTGQEGRTLFSRHHGVDLAVFAAGSEAFIGADEVLLEVFLINVCQAISNQRTFAEMSSDRDAVLHGLARRAEGWDEAATENLQRLAALVSALAARLHTTLSFPDQIDRGFMHHVGVAAMLHDLGNPSLPAGLLSASRIFSPAERALMQTHVAAGIEALSAFASQRSGGGLSLAREIIAGHHEWFDGSGYPSGVRGQAIPLSARLVAVADSYIALTSRRPHRPALEPAAAVAAIRAEAGSHFDPRVVEAFLEIMDGSFGG